MSFDPEKITFFAKTDARGQQVSFGIKAKDRQRHMYVVGKTGMGKSTLLENMAAQDIQNGEGMAFIDPHGSAAQTLLDYIPEHRIDDVIYFAPFDMANPISFNVMEDVGADKRHLVVSGLMSTFKKIWVDAWSARMEYILTNALLALIEYPDTTLLSVNRLFSDKAYRKQVVDYIKDPAVKAFWTEEFANYTDRFAAEALPSIQNKIGQFTGNPLIRNIIGQPHSSFDIREIMDNKKILIMNLSKGLVGETNANLLGSMLTTRIYLAAMSRADLPVEKMRTMPNFYFYVDEFQSFANSTFANILSEARKYHLNLIIAHQYIEQMEDEVRNAVFGNVGTTVSFRVGPFDAEVLETVFTPRFTAADLVNLGFAQIYLTLMIDGIGSQPFSAVTLPPIQTPTVSCKEMVIAASQKNYTKEREVVEKIITDLHTPVKVEPPVRKNNQNNQTNQNNQGGQNNYRSNNQNNSNTDQKFKKEYSGKKPESNQYPLGNKDKNYPETRNNNPQGTYSEKSSIRNFSEENKDKDNYQAKRPYDKKTFGKSDNQTQSLSDLKNILSKISSDNKGGENKGQRTTDNKPVANTNRDRRVGNETKTEKEDLKGALQSLLKKNNNTATEAKTNHSSASFGGDSGRQNKPAFDVSGEADFDYNQPVKRKVIDKDEFHKLMTEAESTFTELETKHNAYNRPDPNEDSLGHISADLFKPKFVGIREKEREEDPLEPKKIEEKLRQSPKEKSPFA